VNTTITEKATQETREFYPVVRPSNTCLLPRCGVPIDEGCTQPLSSDPMIDLNTTVFSFRVSSRLRGISTIWSLSSLQHRSQREHKVRMGEKHTQDSNPQQHHTHKWGSEHTNTAQEVYNSKVLKSQELWSDRVNAESRCLRMFLVSLVFCSMRLGVPFIAPR
jgi:ABC-type nickel/cobalt efflux system permease component RcnA